MNKDSIIMIERVKNGFIVSDRPFDSSNYSAVFSGYVFETLKSLLDWLKEFYTRPDKEQNETGIN